MTRTYGGTIAAAITTQAILSLSAPSVTLFLTISLIDNGRINRFLAVLPMCFAHRYRSESRLKRVISLMGHLMFMRRAALEMAPPDVALRRTGCKRRTIIFRFDSENEALDRLAGRHDSGRGRAAVGRHPSRGWRIFLIRVPSVIFKLLAKYGQVPLVAIAGKKDEMAHFQVLATPLTPEQYPCSF